MSIGTNINDIPSTDKLRTAGVGLIGYNYNVSEQIELLDNRVTILEETSSNISYWKNKKIAFLGDSITAGSQYVNAYATLTGCVVLNYGLAGAHISAKNSSDTYAFENRVSSMDSSADAVIVFGGTNDFGHTSTAPFGTFNDYIQENVYSYYAGLHRTFKQLYDKYRGKPIVIMTPVHHGYKCDAPEIVFNNDGSITEGTNPTTNKTFKEYVNAMKEVAQYYSFNIIDAYSESQLNPCLETENYYFSDGLHLNQLGGNKLAKFMYPLMETIYKIYY